MRAGAAIENMQDAKRREDAKIEPKDSLFTGYNSKNISNAKALRKNMTKQERKLWYNFLRDYPVKIYRQRPIDSYIVDFYCSKAKLAIELDGSQHYDESGKAEDAARTEKLSLSGIRVMRFANNEIDNQFEAVCITIDNCIKEAVKFPADNASPERGGGSA